MSSKDWLMEQYWRSTLVCYRLLGLELQSSKRSQIIWMVVSNFHCLSYLCFRAHQASMRRRKSTLLVAPPQFTSRLMFVLLASSSYLIIVLASHLSLRCRDRLASSNLVCAIQVYAPYTAWIRHSLSVQDRSKAFQSHIDRRFQEGSQAGCAVWHERPLLSCAASCEWSRLAFGCGGHGSLLSSWPTSSTLDCFHRLPQFRVQASRLSNCSASCSCCSQSVTCLCPWPHGIAFRMQGELLWSWICLW